MQDIQTRLAAEAATRIDHHWISTTMREYHNDADHAGAWQNCDLRPCAEFARKLANLP